MALTASLLIDDAELLAFPYVRYPPPPRPMLLRTLGVLDAELVRLILAEAPQALSAVGTPVTIVAGTNATGYSLAAAFQYQGLMYKDKDGNLTPIDNVALERLNDPSATHPAGVIVNQNRFLPVDPLGKQWVGSEARAWYVGDGDTIVYRVTAAPTSPPTLASTLTSPDSARGFFLAGLRLAILSVAPRVPENIMEEARRAVDKERLLALQHAHKQARINSRFGEAVVQSASPGLEE